MNNHLAYPIISSFFGTTGHFLANMAGLSTLVGIISSNLLVIAGVVLIFTIVYAGITMISAAGDAQTYQKAQGILTAAVIGFILVAAAWLILDIVGITTGVNIL